MNRQKLIVITGPTACGKSALAAELALRLGGEVISADSMQVYKYMDIGTAKISAAEMRGVPHYMIDEVYPDEDFSAAVFQEKARRYAAEIASRGKTPIVAGGTGFYINALLFGNDFTETAADNDYRGGLYALAAENGAGFVHDMLKIVDPESAALIHENNLKRVIRALEYHKQTGKKISEHNLIERNRNMVYNAKIIVLDMDRSELYEKIDRRVDEMLAAGLVDEVESLLQRGYGGGLNSMQGIGYKETLAYLQGKCGLDEAVCNIKLGTRHYAKRQITWFKHRMQGAVTAVQGRGPRELCDALMSDKALGLTC